jgi:hypothetical protein
VLFLDAPFRERGAEAWRAFPQVIASLATARRAEHRAAITEQVYDLVIVDEAHHLKYRGKLRELLADVMVRHSRSQISLSLPPRHAHTVRLTLAPESARSMTMSAP